jgi:uncharacterized membrane protein HdeD (DUF308 family)
MFSFWSRYWWVPVVRGLVAIALGVFAFVWPIATITALVLVFGVVALVDGVLAIAAGIAARRLMSDWWVLLLQGFVGIAIGILTVVYPSITALAFVVLIAVWAIGVGVLQIVAAVKLRRDISGGWWLALGGVLGVAFGILLVSNPVGGGVGVVWLIGTFALVWGAMLIIGGFDLRRLTRHATA